MIKRTEKQLTEDEKKEVRSRAERRLLEGQLRSEGAWVLVPLAGRDQVSREVLSQSAVGFVDLSSS